MVVSKVTETNRVVRNRQAWTLVVGAAVAGNARLIDEGTRQFPATGDGVNQFVALGEKGYLVDVVGVDYMPAIQVARTLVVLQVPRIADGIQVVAGEIDLVRVRVSVFDSCLDSSFVSAKII